jgi:hypothetical protein
VRSISDTSGFHSSLALLSEEDKRVRNVIELGEMFKAYAAHENAEAERENAQLAERCRGNAERDARFDSDLAVLAKSFPSVKSEPVARIAEVTAPTEGELVAKAMTHLYFDDGLNAAERGNLLLGVSAAHGRAFAKAQRADQHPVAARVEEIRTALEQARAERELPPNAAVYVDEALHHLAQIGSGIVTADDAGRLQHLLMQIKLAMSAGDTGALGAGDAR